MSAFGRKAYTLEEATRRMERYCAYQERCHREVRDKLREMRMIPQAADSIIVHLIQEGFLNEERFASAFVRGKFRQKKWGRIRLERELKLRGISPFLIDKALTEELPEGTYQEVFESLAQKRWDALKSESPMRRKQKFYSYLQYRGWEKELIFECLNQFSKGPSRTP